MKLLLQLLWISSLPHSFLIRWTKDWKMKLPDIVFDKTCLEISKKDSQNRLQVSMLIMIHD